MSALPSLSSPPSPEPRWLENLPREHGFERLRIEGKLPEALNGTLYRNGPGLLSLFDRPYAHLFEGDGAISAVRFQGGSAQGAARLIQTEALRAERTAGRPLYGSNARWLDRWPRTVGGQGKNVANTNVIGWDQSLWALWEGGLPTRLDPDTLATHRVEDLGAIPGAFSAHPHLIGDTLINFGVRYGRTTELDLFTWKRGSAIHHLATLPLEHAVMLHDFVATDRHLVFFIGPATVRIWRALTGFGDFGDLFGWQPELGTEILIVPLDDPQNPVRFRTEAFWQWHFANAHEAGGRIVVDLCRYDDFSSFEQLGDGQHFEPGVLSRVVIDPSTKTLETTRLWATGCEFPRVHPRLEGQPNRYTWLTTPREDARGDGGIARFDHKTRQTRHLQFEAHQIASEAVFVPRPDGTTEDDGWAICWVYDAREHATFAAVLDGRAPEQGPIAKAWFDHHIPVTFHGNWLAG